MRAAVMHAVRPQLGTGLVSIEEMARPAPEGPDDVVVRITGAGVCRSDLHLLTGDIPVEVPHVLGHENAGVVAAVGTDVTTVAPGDPVLCYPFVSGGLDIHERRGIDSAAPGRITPGFDAPGGYAEYLRSNERSMVRLPEGTDPMPLAALTDAGLAAYRAGRKAAAALRPGDNAVVMGAGGLGHIAIQILRELTPAGIIAVDPKPGARDLAESCGAVATCAPPDLGDTLGNRGAAAVLDFVGSDASAAAGLGALAFGGLYLSIGVGGRVITPTADLVTGEKRIEGVYVGTYAELVELTALALAGKVVPRVTRYALEDADRALRDLAAGAVLGRAVLIP